MMHLGMGTVTVLLFKFGIQSKIDFVVLWFMGLFVYDKLYRFLRIFILLNKMRFYLFEGRIKICLALMSPNVDDNFQFKLSKIKNIFC